MKRIVCLLIICFVLGIASGCDLPEQHLPSVYEGTVVSMNMNPYYGGAEYHLVVRVDGSLWTVWTDSILFHKVSLGSRVRITEGYNGPCAIAVLP